MRIMSAQSVRPRRLRRTMTALAATLGVGFGVMAVPTPAFAIPPGGWCYTEWYDVQSVGSVAHQALIPTRSFQNSSSSTTVTWSESYTNSTTYTSTYSTTTTFTGGVNLGIVTIGVSSAQTRTVSTSITVTTTSSFTAPVPPLTTAYATYGTYKLQTSGTYNKERFGCDDGSFYSIQSGALTAYTLTSVGWHYWDSKGSSSEL